MRLLVVAVSFLLVGCSMKVGGEPKLTNGWDLETYNDALSTCETDIAADLKVSSRASTICKCWVNDVMGFYSPDELVEENSVREMMLRSFLKSCALDSGESLKFDFARFLRNFRRDPLAENKTPPLMKNVLKKAKPADSHTPDGFRVPSRPTIPSAPKFGPITPPTPTRPAPPAAPKEAPKKKVGSLKAKATHFTRESKAIGDTFIPSKENISLDMRMTECIFEKLSGQEVLSLRFEDSNSNSLSTDIYNFRQSQKTYEYGGEEKDGFSPMMLYWTSDASVLLAPKTAKLADVKLVNGKVTGKIVFQKAMSVFPNEKLKDFALDLEGEFECEITDKRDSSRTDFTFPK